jgi:hypothetical protein
MVTDEYTSDYRIENSTSTHTDSRTGGSFGSTGVTANAGIISASVGTSDGEYNTYGTTTVTVDDATWGTYTQDSATYKPSGWFGKTLLSSDSQTGSFKTTTDSTNTITSNVGTVVGSTYTNSGFNY